MNLESYKDVYKNMCRVCLRATKGQMVSLIDITNNLTFYGRAVKNLTNISVDVHHKLPQKMCMQCLVLLHNGIKFKTQCLENHLKMTTFLTHANNINDEDKSIEEFVEYFMFDYHFPNDFKVDEPDDIPSGEELNAVYDDDDHHSDDDLVNVMEKMVKQELQDVTKGTSQTYGQMMNLMKRKQRKSRRIPRMVARRENETKTRNSGQCFVCNVCGKSLSSKPSLMHHKDRHGGSKYICEICGKGFASRSEVGYHLASTHAVGKLLECSQCSFKAARKHELIEHIRLHTGERPFVCSVCGRSFRRKYIFKRHAILHTEKKVQCTQCPRKFHLRSQMLAHQAVHIKKFVYSCVKCSGVFARLESLRRHLVNRHGLPRDQHDITKLPVHRDHPYVLKRGAVC